MLQSMSKKMGKFGLLVKYSYLWFSFAIIIMNFTEGKARVESAVVVVVTPRLFLLSTAHRFMCSACSFWLILGLDHSILVNTSTGS